MKHSFLSSFLKAEKFLLIKLAGIKFLAVVAAASAAFITATVINGVFLEGMDIEKAAPYLAVLLFLLSFRHLLTGYTGILADALSASLRQATRQRLHKVLLDSSPLDGKIAGNRHLFALFTETTDGLDDLARQLIPLLLEALVTLPFLFFLALFIDPWTAGLFFLTFPITPFLLYLIGRVTGKASAREWNRLSKLTANFSELLAAIPSLKIWNQTEGQITRLAKLSDDFSSSSLLVLRLAFVSAFVLELITTLSIALIAVSIGLRLLNGMLTFFPAFYALLLAPLFYQPLRESGIAFHAGVHAIAASKELAVFLDIPQANKQRYTETTQMPPGFTLEHVSFSYANRTAKAINDISLYIPASRTTVLTGTSGIGKSTILRLLAGFAEPSEGAIYLNDLSLRSIDPEFYSSRIAYIPQDPYIFRATLRENITLEFGQDASSIPCASKDERILSALQAASLSYLATHRGLQCLLGQGAVTLSFGERRRLGLARAVYQDAPVWLLDEITAGLDSENEAMILTAIEAYKKCRTIVMTAHRPAVLAIADTIIDMEAEVNHA